MRDRSLFLLSACAALTILPSVHGLTFSVPSSATPGTGALKISYTSAASDPAGDMTFWLTHGDNTAGAILLQDSVAPATTATTLTADIPAEAADGTKWVVQAGPVSSSPTGLFATSSPIVISSTGAGKNKIAVAPGDDAGAAGNSASASTSASASASLSASAIASQTSASSASSSSASSSASSDTSSSTSASSSTTAATSASNSASATSNTDSQSAATSASTPDSVQDTASAQQQEQSSPPASLQTGGAGDPQEAGASNHVGAVSNSPGPALGAIIGGAVGGGIALLIVGIALFIVIRNRIRRNALEDDIEQALHNQEYEQQFAPTYAAPYAFGANGGNAGGVYSEKPGY